MPKMPANPAPPKKRLGRRNVRQAEIYEALLALKQGMGKIVEGQHGAKYLCIALDRDKVPSLSQATAALYNLRYRLNPKRSGDAEEFNRLFGKGRGSIKIEEQGEYLLVFVPASYADEAEVKAKPVKSKAKKEQKEEATVS